MEKPILGLENQLARFKKHLTPAYNKRILFSGPFGSGKSYFLSEFFGDQECDFLSVKLSPINYSVAANQDIFELIKHDLLLELTESFLDEIALEKEDVSLIVAGKTWVDSKLDIFPFLGVLSEINFGSEIPGKIVNELRSVIAGIREHQKSISVDEQEQIIQYLSKGSSQVGSIREMDGVTGSIRDFISRIKDKRPTKPIVLIIDDLDRLDPEHIFRLFNVFTAHDDSRTDENKFGFDKVIFVCDLDNIHHIFTHKYGPKVDFDGYISKFYSSEVFSYDLRDTLISSLTDFYLKTLYTTAGHTTLPASNAIYRFQKEDLGSTFSSILTAMINKHIVKIRNLTKISLFEPSNHLLKFSGGVQRFADRFPMLCLVQGLQQLFPRTEDLIYHLNTLSQSYPSDYSEDEKNNINSRAELLIIAWSAPFIPSNTNILAVERGDKGDHIAAVNNENGKKLMFSYKTDWDGNLEIPDIWMDGSISRHQPKRMNPYFFLLQGLDAARKKGYLVNS